MAEEHFSLIEMRRRHLRESRHDLSMAHWDVQDLVDIPEDLEWETNRKLDEIKVRHDDV